MATGFVGLLHTEVVTLEILPKVEAGSSPSDDADFLRRLLLGARVAPRWLSLPGRTSSARMPLFEMMIADVARRMVDLLHTHGAPRRYEDVEDELRVLQGRLDTARLVRQLPHQRHLLPVMHSPLQLDNPLACILKALAHELYRLTRSTRSRGLLRVVTDRLDEASDLALTPSAVACVRLQRAEQHWHPVVEFAALVAAGRTPDPLVSGETDTSVILFELAMLFERLLRRVLPGVLEPRGLRLLRPSPRALLRSRDDKREALNLRPDLPIGPLGGDERAISLVADAKWKRLKPGQPALGISEKDAYQILAYMTRHRVQHGLLLYPGDEGWSDSLPVTDLDVLGTGGAVLTVASVDVAGLVSRDAERRASALLHVGEVVEHSLSVASPG